jgi:adenylosuccinate synthase
VLWIPTLIKEIADCHVAADRLSIDPHAMVIEPADREFEKTLEKSIGSTGQGVGAATARKVLRLASKPTVKLAGQVNELKPYVRDTLSILDLAFSRGERALLEGTQGTALSLHHGHYPYVTSRDTTVSGCLSEAGIPPARVRRVVMTSKSQKSQRWNLWIYESRAQMERHRAEI